MAITSAWLTLPLLLGTCVPGGAIIIQGQSNAVADMLFASGNTSAAGYARPNVQTWDATYFAGGTAWVQGDPDLRGDSNANGIGQWPGVLGAKVGAARFYVGGRGGMPIGFFLPDDATETPNNFDKLVSQVAAGGTTPAALIWWQGESDTSAWEATTEEDYLAGLETLDAAWTADFPTVIRRVLVRIANPACGGNADAVLAACDDFLAARPNWRQVDLSDLTGNPLYHDGCHYRLPGYVIAANRIYEALQ